MKKEYGLVLHSTEEVRIQIIEKKLNRITHYNSKKYHSFDNAPCVLNQKNFQSCTTWPLVAQKRSNETKTK